jgi:hypothetical protein
LRIIAFGAASEIAEKTKKAKTKKQKVLFSRTNQCITLALRSSQNYISALRRFYINNKPLLYIGISPTQCRLSGILSGKILRDKEVRKYGVSLNTMQTKSASLETWKAI